VRSPLDSKPDPSYPVGVLREARALIRERGEEVSSPQLTGRPAVPRAVVWLIVVLGILAFVLIGLLVAAGGS